MSFFNDASLVMIPSGYKTSKVYSVKPTDGSGDLAFTRSNDTATRVGPDGLIEKVRTNLALYSEQFNNAAWIKSSATVTANTSVSPDGSTTADTLTESTFIADSAFIYETLVVTPSTPYATSIFVKQGAGRYVYLRNYYNAGNAYYTVVIDTQTGTITQASVGSSVINASSSIEAYGNGWYRVRATQTSTVEIALFTIIGLSDTATPTVGTFGQITVAANAGRSTLLWGAQIETGDVATAYIPTTSAAVSVGPVANVPRLDYLNSSCPRLILEPQRQNLVTYSEQLDNAGWGKATSGTALAPVVTANNAISPDGYQNADTIVFDAGAGTTASDSSALFQTFGGTTATYTASFYAKTPSGTAQIQVRIDGGSYDKFTITNQWQRFTLTKALTGTSNTFEMVIRRGLNEPMNASATIQLWGVQVELGAYATSYIPTLGAAVTRGADACSKTGISSLIGQTEGTLFVEFDFNGNYDVNGIVALDVLGTGSNEAYIFVTGLGQLRLELYVSGAIQALITTSIGAAGRKKIAFGYKQNDFVGYMNGVQIGIDTSGNVGAMDTVYIGTYQAITYATGNMSQALLFKTRLSNADLASLTSL